ncbi:MAG: outer membrane protein assembly factor [Rhodothermales bacterium]
MQKQHQHTKYPKPRLWGMMFFCCMGLLQVTAARQVVGQVGGRIAEQPVEVRWQQVIDGKKSDIREARKLPLDSLNHLLERVIAGEREQGYYLAKVDSVSISDTLSAPVYTTFFMDRGPRIEITDIQISGLSLLSLQEALDLMTTRAGRVLSEKVLLEDIDRVLHAYEVEGYPFAAIHIDAVELVYDESESDDKADAPTGLKLDLRVEEGKRVRINDIVLSGGTRTSLAYIEQVTGLRRGAWLNKNLDEVHEALVASQFFKQVQIPRLIDIGRGEVVIQIPVVEEAPGSFDLVLGYQPPSAGSQAQGLVGNGHLTLRNMFGRGRRIALRLNRLPGQVSSVLAEFKDPYLFGLPFSVEGGFNGIQQDSTYGQQAYRGAVGYKMQGGLETFLTISREVTKPGQSGLRLQSGTQLIPRSEIVFAGLTFRYVRVDRPLNPQRGLFIETRLERGRKVRKNLQLQTAGDTTTVRSVVRQERLMLSGRLFIPSFRKQVLVIGNDTHVLVSKDFDTSDLFRIGGAQSLRGYDEDRFRGRLVSRSLVEYRYLFERQSFAYLFFDLGYVDRPETPELEAMRSLYPGYGLGMQFETGIGLINTSLALSTNDNPSQAKVHVGLSLGL